MFTIEQINELHSRLGKASTFSEYVRSLRAIGVKRYNSYLIDGHSEYLGEGGYKITSPPVHESFPVSDLSSKQDFLSHLELHSRGKTTYLEMSKGLAEAGIEEWTVDTDKMTMTYYDKSNVEMLSEQIE
ncbi:DUF1398 domain-containing protein [Deinococcus alpinitundrae]|uniref:DUF1398 domain-containing protein n=1 Tax=Deinococcus alpinitundrae TaxID=468913 RepID=UPI00137B2B83|nr:DUF1398 family protein [Deinococcus alpinitundrae]